MRCLLPLGLRSVASPASWLFTTPVQDGCIESAMGLLQYSPALQLGWERCSAYSKNPNTFILVGAPPWSFPVSLISCPSAKIISFFCLVLSTSACRRGLG